MPANFDSSRRFSETAVSLLFSMDAQRFPRPLQAPNVCASQILRPKVVKVLSGTGLVYYYLIIVTI
jgi:hypothetical protein